jgi:hypothetical protein
MLIKCVKWRGYTTMLRVVRELGQFVGHWTRKQQQQQQQLLDDQQIDKI